MEALGYFSEAGAGDVVSALADAVSGFGFGGVSAHSEPTVTGRFAHVVTFSQGAAEYFVVVSADGGRSLGDLFGSVAPSRRSGVVHLGGGFVVGVFPLDEEYGYSVSPIRLDVFGDAPESLGDIVRAVGETLGRAVA